VDYEEYIPMIKFRLPAKQIIIILACIIITSILVTYLYAVSNSRHGSVSVIKSVIVNGRPEEYAKLLPNVPTSELPIVIIVGSAEHYINIFGRKVFKVCTIDDAIQIIHLLKTKKLVMVIHVDYILRQGPANILGKLAKIFKSVKSFQVIILNPSKSIQKGRLIFQLLLKLLGYYNIRLVLPCKSIVKAGNKKRIVCILHPAIYRAAALAVSYNPTGIVIIENLFEPTQDIINAVKMYVGSPKLELDNVITMKRLVAYFDITRLSGFKFVGYIGWIEANATGRVCHEVTGRMWIKVEYYYTSEAVGDRKYEWFLAYVIHSAKGLVTICNGATYSHTPVKFVDKFDWMTYVWPGQQLWYWGPKGDGGPTTTVTYKATVGLQGETPVAQVSVSYSITTKGSAYEWYNDGNPKKGIIIIVHELLNGKPEHLYTVEPSSIGLLDSAKEGGTEPMILYQYFETQFTYGDTAKIQFYAYILHDTVIKG